MSTEMSLHRIIAQIKAIEAFLQTIGQQPFVFTQTGDDPVKVLDAQRQSQSAYDKVQAAITNLAALKAARNKANAYTVVTVAGQSLTIDEALAAKAAIVFKGKLIETLQSQFVRGQALADQAKATLETKITAQLTSMFSGTKKATKEEQDLIRSGFERTQGVEVVAAKGLKDRIVVLKAEVDTFTTEVDYVLSEANATTKVQVAMV